MKNVSSLKANISNSPKTPGGISKSLLTPCRRVGLSRNWRKSGPSPFISPLSGSSEVKDVKCVETRKRKDRELTENTENTPNTSSQADETEETNCNKETGNDIDKTPSRNIQATRRKKSKTLLTAINKSQEDIITKSDSKNLTKEIPIEESITVSTPKRNESKDVTEPSSTKLLSEEVKINEENSEFDEESNKISDKTSPDTMYVIKERSPNELRKECIVVIQRKIFKTTDKNVNVTEKLHKTTSKGINSDSESDEMPLSHINTKKNIKSNVCEQIANEPNNIINLMEINEDDNFIDKPKIVKECKSPKTKQKSSRTSKNKVEKNKVQPKPLPSSYNDNDDDDDDFDNKKTILIRKTYEKVSKPLKAKSTGSITQRDVDELKARIEAKKKVLLAKSITPDTEELRTLIKKWKKGCQDALMELLDLMKTKFHDKQDMGYSEMLKTLKIPPSLVGYDSDNDCFNTPDDASIILGPFNDMN